MKYSYSALVLATIAIGQAAAGTIKHAHMHPKKSASPAHPPVARGVSNSTNVALTSTDASKLSTLGVSAAGINAVSSNGAAWFGGDGAYTNEFTNDAGEDLILVIWGPGASWVNVQQPLITASLASGQSTTVSFGNGAIGAWSAIYPDTQMVDGQVSNTWGEFTFSPTGVVDVSREPNMNGHGMSIVGPMCTSDMNTCVFTCSSGTICMTNYLLENCAPGSQEGAQYGTFGGFPSGGCGWNGANSAAIKTSFS